VTVGVAAAAVAAGPALGVTAGAIAAMEAGTIAAGAAGAMYGGYHGKDKETPVAGLGVYETGKVAPIIAATIIAGDKGNQEYGKYKEERKDRHLTSAQKNHAFASAAYEGAGARSLEESQQKRASSLKQGKTDGDNVRVQSVQSSHWKQDEQLSDNQHQVWVNKYTKEAKFVARGTTMGQDGLAHMGSDLYNDALIGFGQDGNTRRYKKAESTFKQMREKYPNHKTDTTGHSLGGQIAMRIARENEVRVDAFNPGNVYSSKDIHVKGSRVIRTSADLVSMATTSAVKGDANIQVHTVGQERVIQRDNYKDAFRKAVDEWGYCEHECKS
jgi:hypothetical protein